MNKQVLSPFDCDMCAMIEDITKQEIEVTASDTSIRLSWAQNGSDGNDTPEAQRIEALKQAIRGRLGDRFIEFFYADGRQSVYMKYDPEEMRTRLVDPDATAGTRYCRTLLEVDAIQFRRDNVDDVLRFTGGGTVTTPRTPNGKAMFSFPDGNGIFVDVPESWYIIRELNGRFTARPEKDFKREFEPKGTPAENYTEQPARPVVAQIANLFNELFGTNIASRCRKMEEEFNEYKEAVKHAMPTFDDPGRMNAVIDELADLNAVVFHSAAILGIPQRDLLEMAYDKVKGRQTDPNYKRTHQHEPNKGCGDCSNFMYEDVNGNGYCEAFKSEQRCGNLRCQEYKPKNNRAMNNREQFINEIAEVVNRNSMEKAFNDTPDFILARIAVEAMEMFTRASAHRDDFHEFRTADYARKHKAICESEKKAKPVNTCKGRPLIDVCPAVQMEKQPERKREYKKPEAHDVPKEVEAMAAFFADMFPGSEIQIQRVDLKENPRNKRRAKNQQKNRKGGRNNER